MRHSCLVSKNCRLHFALFTLPISIFILYSCSRRRLSIQRFVFGQIFVEKIDAILYFDRCGMMMNVAAVSRRMYVNANTVWRQRRKQMIINNGMSLCNISYLELLHRKKKTCINICPVLVDLLSNQKQLINSKQPQKCGYLIRFLSVTRV
jgi:hypothetical protein